MTHAVDIQKLSHRYGERLALDAIDLQIDAGNRFALLGPNGGGKTTLFRVLATLLQPLQGTVSVGGFDVRTQAAAVRAQLGVVFQSPALDRKLTVHENIRHRGHLYGLMGATLRDRRDALLAKLGLTERANDRVETLSGGLRRRVELAQCLLHQPKILILDEPTTGLDPSARREFWTFIEQIRAEQPLTVIFTTHYFDEADPADQMAILKDGRIAAVGAPAALKTELKHDVIVVESAEPDLVSTFVKDNWGQEVTRLNGTLRFESDDAGPALAALLSAHGERITAVTSRRADLEDVYVQKTGCELEHP